MFNRKSWGLIEQIIVAFMDNSRLDLRLLIVILEITHYHRIQVLKNREITQTRIIIIIWNYHKCCRNRRKLRISKKGIIWESNKAIAQREENKMLIWSRIIDHLTTIISQMPKNSKIMIEYAANHMIFLKHILEIIKHKMLRIHKDTQIGTCILKIINSINRMN